MTEHFSALIASLLRDCGYPDIADATVTSAGVAHCKLRDGSAGLSPR